MLTEQTACKLLGLSCPSSAEEARKAYRKLAKQHHPDAGGDEEHFKELSAAHQFLSELYEGKTKSDPPEWEEKRAKAQQKAAWDAWRERAREGRREKERQERAQGSARRRSASTERQERPQGSAYAEANKTQRSPQEERAQAEVVEVEVLLTK